MGIQPEYFLDSMDWFELDAVLKEYENQYRNTWEQTRFVAITIAKVNGNKYNLFSDFYNDQIYCVLLNLVEYFDK